VEKREIIAVVGMCGAGKSVVSNFLAKEGYQFLRFGQITLDEVKKRGLELTEENEKTIREEFRQKFGMAAFATLNQDKIDSLSTNGNVVIDGLYSWSEYKILKDKYGESLKVVAVVAPPSVRYSRLEERKIIDEKMRNRPFTREKGKSRDYAEIENIEKGGPIAMADITIINDKTIGDLERHLTEIFTPEKIRRPTWDEFYLDLAQEMSKRSKDPSTKVGAVIVRPDKSVCSVGFNGFSQKMPDSVELYANREEKYSRIIHAEMNALIFSRDQSHQGYTLYTWPMLSCDRCFGPMVQAGIIRFVTLKPTQDKLDRWGASFERVKQDAKKCKVEIVEY
jgi:deoxycytidylate deaminase/predicted kinase